MKVKTLVSTAKVQFLFSGLYETMWSDFVGLNMEMESAVCDEDDETIEFINRLWDTSRYNSEEFMKDISSYIIDAYNHERSDSFVELLDYASSSSPAYYNFSTDVIDFYAEVDFNAVINYISSGDKYIQEYIKRFHADHWETRSGFISFMPTLDEIAEMIDEYKSNGIKALSDDDIENLVALYMNVENIDDFDRRIEYSAYEDMIGNCCPFRFWENGYESLSRTWLSL